MNNIIIVNATHAMILLIYVPATLNHKAYYVTFTIYARLHPPVNTGDWFHLLFTSSFHAVIPILVALQVDQGVWPPYASMMLIELYSTSRGPSVRIVYNGDVVQLPFCSPPSDLCDYTSFSKYMSEVTPTDKTNCAPESSRRRGWKWY